MVQEEKIRRKLPPVLPEGLTAQGFDGWRRDMVALYERECFGVTPPAPASVRGEVVATREDDWAGKATHREIKLSFEMEKGEFSFPVHLVLPHGGQPCPCVVYISFTPYATAGYQPIEEIVDQGWALAVFNYEDVTSDDGDMTNGIAAMTSRNGSDSWGKIGMWAYAASRVLDVLQTVPEVDAKRVAVLGHSRLGKTALWAGTQDTRFAGVVSNDSGCSGAAISRGKAGESIDDICRVFPYWFCENYQKYRKNEENLPFEQNHLLACAAPRPLYVASASEDIWADPASEFLSCCMLEPVYGLFGMNALGVSDPQLPAPGGRIAGGQVGYHLRPGTHYLSRYDWVRALQFLRMRM